MNRTEIESLIFVEWAGGEPIPYIIISMKETSMGAFYPHTHFMNIIYFFKSNKDHNLLFVKLYLFIHCGLAIAFFIIHFKHIDYFI